MEKNVSLRWQGDLEFEASSEDGVSVRLGGAGSTTTYRPATLLLASLAGCTAMDAIAIMTKKRLAIERYVVEATGVQRDEHPRTFSSIMVTHIVEGESIDDVAVARAIELSARKYCVVGATIAAGDTSIDHRFVVRDAAGERTCDCLTIGPRGAGLRHAEEA